LACGSGQCETYPRELLLTATAAHRAFSPSYGLLPSLIHSHPWLHSPGSGKWNNPNNRQILLKLFDQLAEYAYNQHQLLILALLAVLSGLTWFLEGVLGTSQ